MISEPSRWSAGRPLGFKKIAAAEHDNLKRDYDALNESKVTIEKEMYVQSDLLRKITSARDSAEKDRRQFQSELQSLRSQFIDLKEIGRAHV